MDKRTFEANLRKSNIPKVKKRDLISYRSYRTKIFAVVFACFVGLFGFFLVLKVYFDNNPPGEGDDSFFASLYRTFYESPGKEESFYRNLADIQDNLPVDYIKINSPFPPERGSEKMWLLVKNFDEQFAGFLDNDENFNYVFRLPINAEKIRLYENTFLSYVENNSQGSENSSFSMYGPEGKVIFEHLLDEQDVFLSTFFADDEQNFYFLVKNASEIIELVLVELNNSEPSVLYESSFLSESSAILYIDSPNSLVYIEDEAKNRCFVLELFSKSLVELGCEYVKRNEQEILFWGNGKNDGTYSDNIRGEIYSTTQGQDLVEIVITHLEGGLTTILQPPSELRRILLTGANGEVFTNLSYYDGFLWYVKENLTQTGPAAWQPEPAAIEKMNVNDLRKSVVTDKVPISNVLKLVPRGEDLYAILDGRFVGHTRLYRYVPEGFNEPISYPVSYAGETQYWQEVPINLIDLVSVQVLEPEYVIEQP